MYRPDGDPVLCPFGMYETVWNLSSISGTGMKERAARFYAAFQRANGGNDTWDRRAKRLTTRTENWLEGTMEMMRRQGQDLSCSAFLPSIQALAGPGLAEAAARIPNVYEGSHYPEKGAGCHASGVSGHPVASPLDNLPPGRRLCMRRTERAPHAPS
jgi:hypothetical protein